MPCCHRRKPDSAPHLAEQGAPLLVLQTSATEQASHLALFAPNVPTVQWQRIVRKLFRLRYLQRVWGNLGQFLQGFGAGLRSQLRLAYPTGDSALPVGSSTCTSMSMLIIQDAFHAGVLSMQTIVGSLCSLISTFHVALIASVVSQFMDSFFNLILVR